VGSFVATSGQKPWPSTGSFVAAYGHFFMAADNTELHNLDDPALWGRQITDERYLTITRPASSSGR